ncbi:sulfurtransferase-like selenium metabolism protein YedF [Rikenella microfusus]|uniref:Selenium metabolism protein YedF n=1 Tax=Rikenella microfusus TaxID=28139 RepID=A0A379MVJ8_9BACT|nr:sulfurtransferase-like selenium metabolism protein YedF [Rikenella microfusus]SUE34867.1 selenium metabolism protein YedF [Rikenella microfusus]
MKTIDTRGRLCPEPLIMTKRAISGAGPGDEFEVLTDNPTALSNLKSYLTELGIVFRTEGDTVRFVLAGVPSGAAAGTPDPVCGTPSRSVPVSGHGDYCVAVSSDRMGSGNDELGRILLRAFINALGDAGRLPAYLLFYNGGIHLALEGSDTVAALKELERRGVKILVCGTCLDFYDAKERLAVGTVSNMFKITEVLAGAGHVVYP